MNQQNTFPFDIPSVSQKNPGMPAPVLGLLDLNRTVHSGQPLDYAHVRQAKASAQALRCIRDSGNQPQLTEQMVVSAQSRAITLESTYASAEYTPHNVAQSLTQIHHELQDMRTHLRDMDQRMGGVLQGMGDINRHMEGVDERTEVMTRNITTMDQHLQIAFTDSCNLRIIIRNTRIQAPNVLLPLRKTVPRSGLALALPLINILEPAERQAFLLANNPPNVAVGEIGDTPPNFDAFLSDSDLLRMIVFYNENFGITAEDDRRERDTKFRRFLTEF